LKTFTEAKPLIEYPLFEDQKKCTLSAFDLNTIDYPIQKVIAKLNEIPYCFTLQSCYGHFLYGNQTNLLNLVPLPDTEVLENIRYRIAYVALCVKNDKYGMNILTSLKNIEKIDPEYIQFGCANWFWRKQINSYVLQIEPIRFKNKDSVEVTYIEAKHIEKVKQKVFNLLFLLIPELKM
jgi:hypothetical protein